MWWLSTSQIKNHSNWWSNISLIIVRCGYRCRRKSTFFQIFRIFLFCSVNLRDDFQDTRYINVFEAGADQQAIPEQRTPLGAPYTLELTENSGTSVHRYVSCTYCLHARVCLSVCVNVTRERENTLGSIPKYLLHFWMRIFIYDWWHCFHALFSVSCEENLATLWHTDYENTFRWEIRSTYYSWAFIFRARLFLGSF